VLAGSTGRLTLVDPTDGTVIRTFDSGVGSRVEAARSTPDGALLLTGGSDNALRIWGVASGEQLASLPTVGAYASEVSSIEVSSIDLSADGRSVIWSEDERVVLFPGLLNMAANDCDAVQPHLTADMVERYQPNGLDRGCDYSS
jgi:WD40 repeat protein